MNEAIQLEVIIFVVSVIYGIGIMAVYDCFRIFRKIIIHNWFWVGLEDILFWSAAGFLFFLILYEKNDGIIRSFAILAACFGMFIYIKIVGEKLVRFFSNMIWHIIHFVQHFVQIILKPFLWFIKRVQWIFSFFAKIAKKLTKNFEKRLKKKKKTVKIAIKKK